MSRHFSAISRSGGLSRFVILPVAMSLMLVAAGAEAAIVIDPATFKIYEKDLFTPGATSRRSLSDLAHQGIFRVSHGRGPYNAGSGAIDGLQTASSHGGSIPHFSSGSLAASTPYIPTASEGKGRKDAPPAGPHVQLTAGSAVLSDGVLLTPNSGFLPLPTVFPAPHEDLYSHPSLPDHLVPRGERVNVNSVGLAPIAVDVVAVPEPATAIIWALGLAGAACVAGRRRNGRTITHG